MKDDRPLSRCLQRSVLLMVLTVTVPASAAGAQTVLFGELHEPLPGIGEDVNDVAVADLDGNGTRDLVLTAYAQAPRLYLGDGHGVFTDASSSLPSVYAPAIGVAAGDVDGDGDVDMIFACGDPGSSTYGGVPNALLLNDGSGVFADASGSLPAIAMVSVAVELVDVDADGDLDALVANSGDEEFPGERNQLWLGDGAGSFADAPAQLTTGQWVTFDLAVEDVDLDGDRDVVFANGGQSTLFLNDGAGVFADATGQLPGGFFQSRAVAVGDVDGDALPDVVLGDSYGATRLYVNAGGSFTDASAQLPLDDDDTGALALEDFDLDGDLDLLLANAVGFNSDGCRLLLNDGAGVFSDGTATRLPGPTYASYALGVLDVDDDGDLDVLLPDWGGDGHRLRRNDRAGGGLGRLVLPPRQVPLGRGRTYALASGDVDGDGRLDVLLGNEGEQNRLLLGDGTGFFAEGTSGLPVVLDETRAVALGDLDGDGDLDAVVGNGGFFGFSAEQNTVLLGDGAGAFTVAPASLPAVLDNTRAVALGDVDTDGDLDVVIGNSSGSSYLYLNDGAGAFAAGPAAFPLGAGVQRVALADLDGDGTLDVLAARDFLGNTLLLGDGAGGFSDASAGLPLFTDRSWDLAVGDVDGDGDLDALIANGGGGTDRLYVNQGGGLFRAPAGRLPADRSSSSAVLGDVDGDGDLDAVLGSYSIERLYLNDGTGHFMDASDGLPINDDWTFALALEDFDEDGDLDLFHGNVHAAPRLWSNLTTQVAARTVPALGKPLRLDVHGPPHGEFVLYASLAERGPSVTPWGSFRLARQQVFWSRAGVLDAAGRATVARQVREASALLGTTWSWQALVGRPRGFTNVERTTLTDL